MSTTRTSIPSEPTIRRRLIVELRSVPRAIFWLGINWFGLGTIITFVPGSELSWFTIAVVLTSFASLPPCVDAASGHLSSFSSRLSLHSKVTNEVSSIINY